jgi:predicted RNA-binding Zn ribbon-like protein
VDSATGHPILVGGILCLDFVNTVDDRLDQQPVDYLGSYSALIGWCRHADAVDVLEAKRLAHLARGGGEVTLARVREVREALYAVLSTLAGGAPVPVADLAVVNSALADLLGPPALRSGESGLRAGAAGEAALDP